MGNLIVETNDYSLFDLYEFNRDVVNVKKLTASMKIYGWIPAYPMHVIGTVSGRFKIKDGHHRFEVAKRLGIKVKYVVCVDTVDISELNNTKKAWSLKDYLDSYVRAGYPDYIKVKEYINETGINLSQTVAMLGGDTAGTGNYNHRFKLGVYRVGAPAHSMAIKEIVLHLKRHNVGIATNNYFIAALSRIAKVSCFSVSRFKDKISAHNTLFEKRPNLLEYSKLIELVYNRQSQDKIPIMFMADQEATTRNAVKKAHIN